jgi:hypothetical protein
MMIASFKRGLAAGTMSAVFALATGPAALAQAQRSNPQQPTRAKAAPATAKPAQPQAQAATGPGGSSLVASFGDWGVYTAQAGRSKICYALSQPKDRLPKNLNRDPAYLFVSFRPAENVRNEVALVLGFTAKDNGPAEAMVGNAKYALLTKATDAWLKNPAEEGQAIATMSRGQSGFNQALERARKECS